MKKATIDGNMAAANIAYMMNDQAVIYPITPSSQMAENCDTFVYNGKLNIFDNTLHITEMQSEGGAAGTVHGSLLAGAKTTTFTSSQGLLLMIPNMYKIAGEGLPCVFYVSARAIASHALNIFCDYSDIYACLKTGFNIINCSSVQEVNDIAIASELASLESSTPFICFFDGFRTSHELNTIEQTTLEELKSIVNLGHIKEFKARALNNHMPYTAGTNQNPDVFMQNRMLALNNYSKVIGTVKSALKKQEEITGRAYDTVEYFGPNNANEVVVTMGSAAEVLNLATKQYNGKVGVMKIRLLKPFDEETFITKLPKHVKKITILERNLDVNGVDTLTSFVLSTLHKHNIKCETYSGCYGLGGKEFTPDMAISVFDNMSKRKKKFFSVGIYDDVNHTNLEVNDVFVDDISDFSMRVYGFGSDGSVSALKNTIKILSDETVSYMQGYFDYDSKKSGSLTISHLRSSSTPINAPFNPRQVDFVMCNQATYIEKYDITECLKPNGKLLINSNYDVEMLNKIMPNKMKQDLIEKNISLYNIDANKIADEFDLGKKINTSMQTAMFYITNIIPFDTAMENIKNSTIKTYGTKGQKIIDANLKAIDNTITKIEKIDLSNLILKESPVCRIRQDSYYEDIILPTSIQAGDEIPSSKFNPYGFMPTDTAKSEKRGFANQLPDWISDKCIQCGRCVIMCPHSALKSMLIDENKKLPKTVSTKKAFGQQGNYRMQVSALDCTGCSVCSEVCPVKAISMEPAENIKEKEIYNEQYLSNIKKLTPPQQNNVRSLQYKDSYFEFSGACAGCGETSYIKLATTLFGDRMLIANATGCSSIYGGSFPTSPYAKDKDGFGPSWANSLFEDNAEFGYGIAIAKKNERRNFINKLKNMKFSKKINELMLPFIKNTENHEYNKHLILELKNYKKGHLIKGDDCFVFDNISLITSQSVWIFGGDGWAYDIGYGGLDHVVASGENVNILILDTEVYSNTGGQSSKATPRGAAAKFNLAGKPTKKKDLASILLTYKDVYVATVAMGANPEQCVNAFVEAETYEGTSVIIAYSPCVAHGYDMKNSQQHTLNSVKSGYNTLFRHNPSNDEIMKIDSYDPTLSYNEYIESENRFASLEKINKAGKQKLFESSKKDAESRRQTYISFSKALNTKPENTNDSK